MRKKSANVKIAKGCAFDSEDEFIERAKERTINSEWNLRCYKRNLMPFVKGKTLEAGCGVGMLAPLFNKNEYLGLDVSKKFIAFARKQNPDYKFITHDLTKRLPFKDKEFDTAIILYVLHHIKNWKFVVEELKRVSKKVVIFEVIYRHRALKLIFFIPFLIINKFTLVNFFMQGEFEGSTSRSIPKTEKDPKAKFIDNVAQILNLFFIQKIFIINCVK